jgi:hypothetical protein
MLTSSDFPYLFRNIHPFFVVFTVFFEHLRKSQREDGDNKQKESENNSREKQQG